MKLVSRLLTSGAATLAVVAASSAHAALKSYHFDPAPFSFYVTDPEFASTGYIGGAPQVYPLNVPNSYGFTFPNGVDWVDFGLDGETLTFGEGNATGYQLMASVVLWTDTLLYTTGGRDYYKVTFPGLAALQTIQFTNPATGSVEGVMISQVPEPATWSLMLLGFGGLGAMVRRRRALAI